MFWTCISLSLVFLFVLAADTILTIVLLLATTKRLTAVSGASLGYLAGIGSYYGGEGSLVGSYALGIGVALAICQLYVLRQTLKQSRWPFQRPAPQPAG